MSKNLDEKITRAVEIIRKVNIDYPTDKVAVAWTGGKDSMGKFLFRYFLMTRQWSFRKSINLRLENCMTDSHVRVKYTMFGEGKAGLG